MKVDDSQLWHEQLGHLYFTDVKITFPRIWHAAKDVYEIRAWCKVTKVSVPKETEVKTTKLLEKLFIGILGPLNPQSDHGFRYVFKIVGDYS